MITPAESYDGFIPCGVSDVAILARSKCKTPKTVEKRCSMKCRKKEVDSIYHLEV